MKKILLFLPVIVLTVAFSLTDAVSDTPYKEITAEQLVNMKSNNAIVIDSRGGKYFDGEIIEGAIHLSVKDTSGETLGKVVPSKGSDVVFYCSNTACQASALSAYKAFHAGYTSLYKYPGGIEEWKEKGLPTATIN